jgi:predicted choloylglycine hydrolase
MENELIMAADTCCDVITTMETPISLPNVCTCDNSKCDDKDNVHEEFVKLAAVLQESVLHAWKLHLKTKKYYVHVILQEYYDEALEIIDGLIEHYQGICNCVIVDDRVPLMCVKNDDPLTYFTDLKNYLLTFLNNPNNFTDKTSEIKSDIDDLLRLIDSTLYKLGNLTESKIKSFDMFVYENYNG